LPYLLFIFLFKQIIVDNFSRLVTICLISLIWFVVFHLFILKDSYFKQYTNKFLEKFS